MSDTPAYSYQESVKSSVSDELVNTYLLRPAAGVLVRILFPTRITPNHVTLAALGWGCVAAALYARGSPAATALAGVCVTLKDLFDSADGQLARAKQQYSRAGRFLDSIGDFIVNALVFSAISWTLWRNSHDALDLILGMAGFWGITLRVSYHVFYQTSFLHQRNLYAMNRTTEEAREEDRAAEPTVRRLQALFQVIYGWQDRLMVRIDAWSRRGAIASPGADAHWYGDAAALRLSGFLGLGTELFLLTACSMVDGLRWYLVLNVAGMNALWGATILYRRWVLAPRVWDSGG